MTKQWGRAHSAVADTHNAAHAEIVAQRYSDHHPECEYSVRPVGDKFFVAVRMTDDRQQIWKRN